METQAQETTKATQLTINEFDEVLKSIALQQEKIEVKEAELTELNKELARLEGKATNYLNELGRTEYDSPHGKGIIEQKWRVNLPSTDLEKKDFFEYLREKGIFDKYATVNSNSLNSLYMSEWNNAKKEGEGMTFNMPGIGAPKLFEKFKLKPKKVKKAKS